MDLSLVVNKMDRKNWERILMVKALLPNNPQRRADPGERVADQS